MGAKEPLFTRFEQASLIAEAALRVYTAHVQAGKGYADPEAAVHIAAAIFGFAQAEETHALVNNAADKPLEALEGLKLLRRDLGRRVDADFEARTRLFAESLRTEADNGTNER